MEDKETAVEQAIGTVDFAHKKLLRQAIDDFYNPFANNSSSHNLADFYDTARMIAISKGIPWTEPASRGKEDESSSVPDDGGTAIAGKYYSSDEMESARTYGYDVISGKPVDMTADEWDNLNRGLLLEGMDNKPERHDAARAIWRQERYIRKQLE
jgi:hypothetical protein